MEAPGGLPRPPRRETTLASTTVPVRKKTWAGQEGHPALQHVEGRRSPALPRLFHPRATRHSSRNAPFQPSPDSKRTRPEKTAPWGHPETVGSELVSPKKERLLIHWAPKRLRSPPAVFGTAAGTPVLLAQFFFFWSLRASLAHPRATLPLGFIKKTAARSNPPVLALGEER
jgi:hypothetical protein